MERTVCPDWERWGRLHRNEFSFICSFNSLHCATVPESVMDAETTMVNQTTNKPVQSSVIRTMRGIVKGAMGVKRNDIKSSLGSLGRKVTTNLDSILKSKDITWPTKVLIVKAMVFLVVMYGCESWTIKKADCQRIDAFELWWWRRLLRVPWTARRSNQSILKEISPEYSLEGLMLKLKLQYFDHLMQRVESLEKTPMLGGIGSRRRRGRQRMRWLDGITDSMDVI